MNEPQDPEGFLVYTTEEGGWLRAIQASLGEFLQVRDTGKLLISTDPLRVVEPAYAAWGRFVEDFDFILGRARRNPPPEGHDDWKHIVDWHLARGTVVKNKNEPLYAALAERRKAQGTDAS